MGDELRILGSIVDSWLEPPIRRRGIEPRVILQVAPRGRTRELLLVEASASLVPDDGWLDDLGGNLCHGSPVAALGHMTGAGALSATQLRLER
jgi:hypothetical protein